MCHRQFFIKSSHNRDYNQTSCKDRKNPFHFACRQWYSYNNAQYTYMNSHTINILIICILVRILFS